MDLLSLGMSLITLATLNARYIHASLGLRYLKANMGKLYEATHIQEFVINTRPIDIAEKLLAEKPDIIGLSIYIWNVAETTQLVRLIKTISPETIVIIGGPEVSYETGKQAASEVADYIITGMADHAFAALCQQLLQGEKPLQKIIHASQPDLNTISLPYDNFNDEDIANRVIYVEASRGCPFKCEFCLSSLDKTAWPFNIDEFLNAMQKLYDRGVRHFKFVDRTFNLKIKTSIRIMQFFLQKIHNGAELFLHFELIPDHLPEQLKELISQFPAGSLQFEIGIQSFNPDVQQRISRKQDNSKAAENIQWLASHTSAHLHTDLIIGLPGEDIHSFAAGFDQLFSLNPDEIQVGILKRLRGTPIIRHTGTYKMKYNPAPPYNILATDCIDFYTMQRLSRFARYWDMLANSGRFKNSLPCLLGNSPFKHFLEFTDWLYLQTDQTHKISLKRLFQYLYLFLKQQPQSDKSEAAILDDYAKSGLKGEPDFIDRHKPPMNTVKTTNTANGMKRQNRHAR